MPNYALVNGSNVVDSVIVWDGSTPWQAPGGLTPIQSDDAQAGWSYDPGSGIFTAPTPPPPPDPTPEQLYATKIAGGIAITSTGTPAISATYGLDDTTLAQIQALANDCAVGFGFPSGQTTFNYPDMASTPHTFTSANIINLYKAMRALIFNMQTTLATLEQGGSAPWPSQTVTIA